MLRPGLVCVVVLASLVLSAARARAEEPPRLALDFHLRHATPRVELREELPDLDLVLHPELAYVPDAPARPEQVPRWYGKTLLLADPASLGLALTGERQGNDVLLGVGLAGMLLSSTVVHAWHGHGERGLLGLLVRAGATFMVGALAGSVSGDDGRLVGQAVGYLGAVAFDGVYLCRDLVDEETGDEPGFAPDLNVAASGASVGLRGRF